MDVRYLGPLEVRVDGTPVPLGGRKQRGILAVLLLEANTVVSSDRLVDDVWGGTPPRTVQAYVQNCVSRLRGVLGRDAIETHPSGYLLRIDPGDVDALRFARAVEAARSLEAPERTAALTEALALWRGPPLAEFAYEPFAQPEISRLEELRLEAVEARLEAQLELGRHAAALPELEALAARHPSRERLRYLQMLALYRAGRQRDALDAYQETRRELVERFGLDPSEELRALERMILAQDPALDGASRRPEAPAGTVVALAVRPQQAATADARRYAEDDAVRAVRAAASIRDAAPGARVVVERIAEGDDEPLESLLASVAPGEIVVGPSLLPLVAHAVDVLPHAEGGFRVLHVDDAADALPRRFHTPLVGRHDELARLEDELARAAATASTRRVVVVGDGGIGKTRLVREFASRTAALVLTARCLAHDAVDVAGALLAGAAPAERFLADEPDGDRVAAALAGRARAGSAEEQWLVRRVLESAARAQPVVVVIDDLQWAPPGALDLVDYLTGWARGPILVLGVARPELLEARGELAPDALHLGPLPPDEAARLARGLPEAEELDGERLDELAAVGEGNPLYIEQIVAWSSEGHAERVPPTIDVLIAMRVAGLAPAERRVLERASVAGAEFWRGAVEAAAPVEERAATGSALLALVRRRLVHPAPSPIEGEDGFRFHHVLIRDAVYARMPADVRAPLHVAIARSLGDAPEHDAAVGRHLEAAASVDPTVAAEAARRLGAAGLRALKRIDTATAIDLLGRAGRLTPDEAKRRDFDWGLAAATKFGGDPVRADALLEDVAGRAAAADDPANELRARMEQIWPRLSRGELAVSDALGLLDRAVAVLEREPDVFALARAWDVTAAVHGVYLLQCAACEDAELRALAYYEQSDSTTGAGAVRLAGAAWSGPASVDDALERCERILAETDTPVWASFVQPFVAGLHAMQGRFAEARAALEAARAGRAEFSDPRTLDTSWAWLAAEVELRAGGVDAAERVLAPALGRLRAAGNAEWIAVNGAQLGDVRNRQGRHAEALALADAALAAMPAAHLTNASLACRVRAAALADLGRAAEALEAARGIVDALEPTDALVHRARALLVLADVLDRLGDTGEAARRRAEARELLERKGDLATLAAAG